MAEQAQAYAGKNIYLLTGGFHLGSKSDTEIRTIIKRLKRLGVQKIAPSHCTGGKAISLSREMDTLADHADPEIIAVAAEKLGCRCVAYTYNDPVIFHEHAIDVAKACRERGIHSVVVTAGYVTPESRAEFYRYMDAANVDPKGFTEDFYHKLSGGHLAPVLDTIKYIRHETDVWLELTTLLIPGQNDSDKELNEMTQWVVTHLGPDVPMHFTAFHPAHKMMDVPPTPIETLYHARRIAMDNGVRYVFTGNIDDKESGSTWCYRCGELLIERRGYSLTRVHTELGMSTIIPSTGSCRVNALLQLSAENSGIFYPSYST